jgi:TolB-like protein/Tfp pilus assembly protein PilF
MRVDLERLSLPVSAAAPKRKPVRSSRWLWVATGVVAVTAILLVLSFGGLRDWLSGGVVEPIESLAVLPLENLSGDPEQEYFTEGMTEELIAELSKISALRVISRQSVMRFKDTTVPLPDIARALNVDAIVEGSVRRSGGRVRITTQLVQAYPEQHLWAESYERDMQDILTLQSQVARAIAQEIQITLTAEEQSRLTRDRAVDPEVYEACLKARFHFEYSQPDEAKEYIQKAMTLDSTYAPAYALLARYYISLAYLRTSSPKEVFPKAREAATKALELDERLAEAHGRLAFVMCAYDWDWLGAEIEYRRALELNPGLVMTRSYYSNFLSAMGRHEEAMAEAQKAQELDPLSPSSNMWMGVAFRFARRYDESIEQLQETTTMFPNHPFAQFQLGWTYCYKQMYEEAAAAFIKASNLVGDSRSKASLAHAYALSGRRDEALKILDELHELEKRSYVPPGFIAFAYIGLGQTDQALRWFEKAYEIPDGEMFLYRTMFRIYPYKAFRDDPRFQDLVRRMNFPQ